MNIRTPRKQLDGVTPRLVLACRKREDLNAAIVLEKNIPIIPLKNVLDRVASIFSFQNHLLRDLIWRSHVA